MSARSIKLSLAGQEVTTPTFMPVGTRASVKGLTMDQVRATGASIVLGNTYHLHLAPGEDVVAQAGGLSEFSKWRGPMLTDSGGFQVFSLAKINKITDEGVWFTNPSNGDEIFISPEISMQIQHKLGADIIMAFDDVVSLDHDERARTGEAMDRTHAWLERCIVEHKRLSEGSPNPPKLFGIVQGGLDQELRQKSLDFVSSTDVDGIAIGGLSVGETREEMHSMLDFLADKYPAGDERARYLMGVGHPIDLRYAIERGIDMADCVLPTRNARHGTGWIHKCCTDQQCHQNKFDSTADLDAADFVEGSGAQSQGRKPSSFRSSPSPRQTTPCSACAGAEDLQINFKAKRFEFDQNVIEPGCDCWACQQGYSRSYIRHLLKVGEALGGQLLSIHNLRYLQRICESYKR